MTSMSTPSSPPVRHRSLSRAGEAAWLASFWVAFAALAYLFPRNGDDWGWGSAVGLQRLDDWFRNYNGRYAGDLLVIALTRVAWLAPLVVSAVVVATLLLVLELTGNRSAAGYGLVAVGFLVMPRGQWAEAVAWLSGFCNYAPATLAVLAFFGWLRRAWRLGSDRTETLGRVLLRRAAIVVLAVVSALFVENVTLYLILAAVVGTAALAVHLRRRPLVLDGACWLAGYLGGAALMFSNNSYRHIAHAHVHQHRIDRSDAHLKFVKLGDKIAGLAFGGNVVVNVALVALACGLVALSAQRLGRLALPAAVVAGVAALGINASLMVAESETTVAESWRVLQGVAALALLALLAVAGRAMRDPARRLGLYGCLASIVVLDVPLVFVNPIGARNFYTSYLLLLVVAGLLAAELPTPGPRWTPRLSRALGAGAGVVAAALCSGYFVVYGVITHAADQQLRQVRVAVAAGERAVEVNALPFGDFVHLPDPTPGLWTRRYAEYYGLPNDLILVIRPPGAA